MSKRIRSKYWVIYHLKKAGFTQEELAHVYRVCLLPVFNYCAVVYHSLLTGKQDQKIERLQAQALRCIYRYELSYSKMRQLAKVTTLRDRRVLACDKFANKCLASWRFEGWFPKKRAGRGGI